MRPGPVALVAALVLVTAPVALAGTAIPAGTADAGTVAPAVGSTLTDSRTCPARAAASAADAPSVDGPRIVELYPDPTTHENVGEFFVLAVPPDTHLGTLTVTDGHTTASLPNETVSGRVAVSMDPGVTANLTDDPVVALDGYLRLSAEDDDLTLRDGNRTVDAVSYDRAPEGERWYRDDATLDADSDAVARGEWWPHGATCRPVSSHDPGEATTFVLPDSPAVPLETLRNADDRIRLAGYTFASEEIAAELAAAADRGVDVTVLVEGGPVGGTPAASDPLLADLEDRGVDVRALGGEGSRYRHHHAKYAVVDDSVVVTSENWKPAGVGGAASRGWGVRVDDEGLADDLSAVFAADATGRDAASWERHRADASFVDDEVGSGAYPEEHDPRTVPVDDVELLIAPDNAEARLLGLVDGAEESILLEQASLDPDAALTEAVLAAADRGVEVRILLDASWYVEDENAAAAAELEAAAAADDLPLEVALVEPDGRFEKIHAKGIVVDGETAVVGSANWNDAAFETNREVLLVLHGTEAASFYEEVFEADWSGRTRTLPVELVAAVVVGLALVVLGGRRCVRFSRRAGSRSRAPRRGRRRPSSRRERR